MENVQPNTGQRPGLAVFADMVYHCCEVRLDSGQSISDLAQMLFERIHAGPQTFLVPDGGFGVLRWSPSVQHCVDVLGMSAQRGRKRFQGPCAAASLHDVMLDFADGRPRNVRTFRKLALPPAEFIHPLVDGLGDGRPVLHLFLRAPPRRRD